MKTMNFSELREAVHVIRSAADDLTNNQPEEVINKLFGLVKREIVSPEIYNVIGRAYMQKTNPRQAMFFYKKGLLLNSKKAYLHFNLAQAYEMALNFEDAIKEYEKAYKTGDKSVLEKLVFICEDLQDYEKAQHYSLVQDGLVEL